MTAMLRRRKAAPKPKWYACFVFLFGLPIFYFTGHRKGFVISRFNSFYMRHAEELLAEIERL